MKSAELVKLINRLDPDGKREVVISTDDEGNGFGVIDDKNDIATFETIRKGYLIIYPFPKYADIEGLP